MLKNVKLKSVGKKRILLVWNYDRKDWIEPFLNLRDQFHFVFLSKYYEDKDKSASNTLEIEMVYWTDFSSPGEVLKRTQPDAIVFMSISNLPDIILNRVAQKKGISTIILQHGLFYSQETYKERAKLLAKTTGKLLPGTHSPKSWQVKYFLSGLMQGVSIVDGIRLCRYLFQKRKLTDVIALEKNKFAARMPSKFVVYTKKNGIVYLQRDGATESDMIVIGNPTLDRYFQPGTLTNLPFNNYYLLIDSPLYVEKSASSGFGFSKQRATDIYQGLAGYARARGKKLVIKLHPFSYNEDELLLDPDVIYTRDENDPKDLIACAEAVISFPSTLAIPAIYFKPVILLKFAENSFLDFVSQAGLPVVSVKEISAESPDPVWIESARKFVLEECLYRADGKSLHRLKDALNDLCK